LNEPASPVPLLLKRALRLVEKNFFEIMQDLAPDSVAQIKLISGIREEEV
jgi:type VI secretion system protein ImpA